MERTLKALAELDGRVYVYLANDEAGKAFLSQAELEGIQFDELRRHERHDRISRKRRHHRHRKADSRGLREVCVRCGRLSLSYREKKQ